MGYWVYSPLLPGGVALAATVSLSVTDSCTLDATDTAALSGRTLFPSDSLTVQPAEQWRTVVGTDQDGTSISFTHWEVPDPLTAGFSDTAWAGNTIVVIGLSDATPKIAVSASASESCAVQVSDASPSITVVLTASDSLAVKAIDAYQPFPVTAVLDTFNRSNEGPPPGSGWVNAFAGSLQLVGNQVVLGNPVQEGAAGWNTALPSTDMEAFVTIGTVAPPDGSGPFGILLRMQDPTDYTSDSYRLLWQNTGTVAFVELEKYVSGAAAQLDYTYLSTAIAVGDQLGVSVIGSTFRVYRNGVMEWTTTDSSVTTGLYAGLWIIQNNTVTLDNFGGGASAVGGASVFVAEPAVDSLPLGLTDAFTGSQAVSASASESCAVQASDATPANAIMVSVADSCTVQAVESTPIIDTGEVPATPIAASEDGVLGLTEEVPVVVSLVVASDSCGYAASDLVDISTARPITASDTGLVAASDATPTLTVSISVSDTTALAASEAAAVFVALSASDSLAIQASEGSPTTTSVVTASDTCATIAADAIDISVARPLATADTLVIQAAEAAPTQAVTVTASDSLAVQASEAASILAPTSASDACAIQATEAAPNIVQSASFSVADSNAIQASEATPIIGQAFTVADSLAVQSSDVINTAAARAISAQESLAIQQTDETTNNLPTAASESLRVGLDDQPAIFYTLSASDSCTLGLTDTITFAGELIILVAKNVADTVLVNAEDLGRTPVLPAEVVAMLLLESVSVVKTWVEVWGGGMRVEDAHHIYATSTRMGPLPADQDRGGIW